MSMQKILKIDEKFKAAVLNQAQTAKFVGLSYRTVIRLRQRGDFAPEIELSEGRVGWLVSDLLDWLESKKKPVK